MKAVLSRPEEVRDSSKQARIQAKLNQDQRQAVSNDTSNVRAAGKPMHKVKHQVHYYGRRDKMHRYPFLEEGLGSMKYALQWDRDTLESEDVFVEDSQRRRHRHRRRPTRPKYRWGKRYHNSPLKYNDLKFLEEMGSNSTFTDESFYTLEDEHSFIPFHQFDRDTASDIELYKSNRKYVPKRKWRRHSVDYWYNQRNRSISPYRRFRRRCDYSRYKKSKSTSPRRRRRFSKRHNDYHHRHISDEGHHRHRKSFLSQRKRNKTKNRNKSDRGSGCAASDDSLQSFNSRNVKHKRKNNSNKFPKALDTTTNEMLQQMKGLISTGTNTTIYPSVILSVALPGTKAKSVRNMWKYGFTKVKLSSVSYNRRNGLVACQLAPAYCALLKQSFTGQAKDKRKVCEKKHSPTQYIKPSCKHLKNKKNKKNKQLKTSTIQSHNLSKKSTRCQSQKNSRPLVDDISKEVNSKFVRDVVLKLGLRLPITSLDTFSVVYMSIKIIRDSRQITLLRQQLSHLATQNNKDLNGSNTISNQKVEKTNNSDIVGTNLLKKVISDVSACGDFMGKKKLRQLRKIFNDAVWKSGFHTNLLSKATDMISVASVSQVLNALHQVLHSISLDIPNVRLSQLLSFLGKRSLLLKRNNSSIYGVRLDGFIRSVAFFSRTINENKSQDSSMHFPTEKISKRWGGKETNYPMRIKKSTPQMRVSGINSVWTTVGPTEQLWRKWRSQNANRGNTKFQRQTKQNKSNKDVKKSDENLLYFQSSSTTRKNDIEGFSSEHSDILKNMENKHNRNHVKNNTTKDKTTPKSPKNISDETTTPQNVEETTETKENINNIRRDETSICDVIFDPLKQSQRPKGCHVRVWSKSAQCWGRGRIINILSNGHLKVQYTVPTEPGEILLKTVPCNSPDVQRLDSFELKRLSGRKPKKFIHSEMNDSNPKSDHSSNSNNSHVSSSSSSSSSSTSSRSSSRSSSSSTTTTSSRSSISEINNLSSDDESSDTSSVERYQNIQYNICKLEKDVQKTIRDMSIFLETIDTTQSVNFIVENESKRGLLDARKFLAAFARLQFKGLRRRIAALKRNSGFVDKVKVAKKTQNNKETLKDTTDINSSSWKIFKDEASFREVIKATQKNEANACKKQALAWSLDEYFKQ